MADKDKLAKDNAPVLMSALECSYSAYSPDGCKLFQGGHGFSTAIPENGPVHVGSVPNSENFALVGVIEEHGKKYAAVAFRGTVLNFSDDPNILVSVTNVKQDFYFFHQVPVGHGCPDDVRVHAGFHEALGTIEKNVVVQLQKLLRDHDDIDRSRILVFGHSLGGAMAKLFAFKLCKNLIPGIENFQVSCVTFGQPHIGNKSFCEAIDTLEAQGRLLNIRITNYFDPVPRILTLSARLPRFLNCPQYHHESSCEVTLDKSVLQKVSNIANAAVAWTKVDSVLEQLQVFGENAKSQHDLVPKYMGNLRYFLTPNGIAKAVKVILQNEQWLIRFKELVSPSSHSQSPALPALPGCSGALGTVAQGAGAVMNVVPVIGLVLSGLNLVATVGFGVYHTQLLKDLDKAVQDVGKTAKDIKREQIQQGVKLDAFGRRQEQLALKTRSVLTASINSLGTDVQTMLDAQTRHFQAIKSVLNEQSKDIIAIKAFLHSESWKKVQENRQYVCLEIENFLHIDREKPYLESICQKVQDILIHACTQLNAEAPTSVPVPNRFALIGCILEAQWLKYLACQRLGKQKVFFSEFLRTMFLKYGGQPPILAVIGRHLPELQKENPAKALDITRIAGRMLCCVWRDAEICAAIQDSAESTAGTEAKVSEHSGVGSNASEMVLGAGTANGSANATAFPSPAHLLDGSMFSAVAAMSDDRITGWVDSFRRSILWNCNFCNFDDCDQKENFDQAIWIISALDTGESDSHTFSLVQEEGISCYETQNFVKAEAVFKYLLDQRSVADGCGVEVQGIVSRPELNGCRGIIIGKFDAEKHRWPVRVSNASGVGDGILLTPDKLRVKEPPGIAECPKYLFCLAQIILQKEQSLELSRQVNSLLQEFIIASRSDDLLPMVVQAKHDLIKSQFKLARDLQEVRPFDVDEVKTLFESVVTGCTASVALHEPRLKEAHSYLALGLPVSKVLILLKNDGFEVSPEFGMYLEASVFLAKYYYDKAKEPPPTSLSQPQLPHSFEALSENLAKAANHGHNIARAELSMILQVGRLGVSPDLQRAFSLAEAGAQLGCCHCQGALACCYYFGRGVKKSADAALKLANESRDKGSAYGFYVCGLCHEPELLKVSCFSVAADQGLSDAQYRLGVMFANGRGVAKDDVEAVRLYRLAVAQGHADAQCNLGYMFTNGRGVAKDDVEAVRLYRLAVEQGNEAAQNNLGSMFESGRGVAKDEAEAVRLYRLAVAQGYASAQYNLGLMFENGQGGVAKSRDEAVKLYCLAAKQGNTRAIEALKRLKEPL